MAYLGFQGGKSSGIDSHRTTKLWPPSICWYQAICWQIAWRHSLFGISSSWTNAKKDFLSSQCRFVPTKNRRLFEIRLNYSPSQHHPIANHHHHLSHHLSTKKSHLGDVPFHLLLLHWVSQGYIDIETLAISKDGHLPVFSHIFLSFMNQILPLCLPIIPTKT